jgi:phage-related baseplate assembly protein
MPVLPTQSFQTIVANVVSGIQGRASKLINFATGSTLRAIAEGFAGLFLWFQALVLQLLSAIRLSTSSGVDVDTFTADFMPVIGVSNGVQSPRLGAQKASGLLTFARFTAAPASCFVPVGSTVQTSDGSQSFAVTADATNAYYSSILNGYTLPSSIASMTIPAAALVPGYGGNIAIGAISVITSPITGIDTVVNGAAFTNGADQESDSSLKNRFAAYILGLSRGDHYGLTSSLLGTGITIQWTLTEGFNLDGTYHPGYFFIIADDGSGAPSADFLAAVRVAAEAVRPLGIMCGVFSATIIMALPSMIIATAPGYDHPTVVAQVSATLKTNINALGLGNGLGVDDLYEWAKSVAGVTKVTALLLNGLSGDAAYLSTTRLASDSSTLINYATIKCTTVTVS